MNVVDPDKLLFTKYYRALCHFAWQLVHDEHLAEDLAQDAFISYMQHKRGIAADERAIKSFLYSSVKFAVYNLNRKNKTMKRFWNRTGFEEADDMDYEHELIRTEFSRMIHETIATLPEGCRRVMTMSYVDGYSNEEISEQLEISLNTIKTHKKRGLHVLRSKLRPDYFSVALALFLSDL
ncbi:RNA polymerase sigma-70 factor [Sphingobacterium suaedae]|uniref:RNA polymerase sigma-70 factor n=1 Tax=Sphingobacterium suaedae TaxID=1686402 RepID=A0ABW5KK38_9SPHI